MDLRKLYRELEYAERLFMFSDYKTILNEHTLEIIFDNKKHKKFALRVYVVLMALFTSGIYFWFASTPIALLFFGTVILGLLYINNVNKKVTWFLMKIEILNKRFILRNYQTKYKLSVLKFSEIQSIEVSYFKSNNAPRVYSGQLFVTADTGKKTLLLIFQSINEGNTLKRTQRFKAIIEKLVQVK